MDDFPVTGPRILLQFGDRPYDSRTQGVEMDVLHHIEKILGFVYGRRLVTILEEVPYAIVPLVEILGISRQQTLHEGSKRTRIALQYQVKMVWHQGPGRASYSPPGQVCADSVEEGIPVDIVEEEFSLLDPSCVNVMDRARKIYPWPSWHTRNKVKYRAKCNGSRQGGTRHGRKSGTDRFLIPYSRTKGVLAIGQPVR